MSEFSGAKGAVFFGDKLLVYLRDDKPELRYANMWDFPGGGREGDETPQECFFREAKEEFSLNVKPEQIVWQKEYPSMDDPGRIAHFFVVRVPEEEIAHIVFGDEGQRWELVDPQEFLSREDAVPRLKTRLSDYLASVLT